MNAWCGLILWGEATGDRALRDLGVYLYTTEMNAINEYWFDVLGRNRPRAYTPSVVTMVWGGKGVNATWFTQNPEAVHGINCLPIHGGSLYLGQFPSYVEKNYAALVAENSGTNWDEWADLIWMYRALADPEDAIAQFERAGGKAPAEAGNSAANTYHWISGLRRLGRVDATVTADEPISAVFQQGPTRIYCVYSMDARPRTVRFSDGHRATIQGRGFSVSRAERPR
jgi:endoglucanase Acf2